MSSNTSTGYTLTCYNTEGTVLGLYKNEIYTEEKIQLKTGDRLFFYTDGITDAKNKENTFFDINGLENTILKYKAQTIQEVSNIIFKAISLISFIASFCDCSILSDILFLNLSL